MQFSTNHEDVSQLIMKIGNWLHYCSSFLPCLIIDSGRIKLTAPWRICTPFFNVNVLPLSTAYCCAFLDSTSSKVRITSGKSPANSVAKEIPCMKDLLEISCGLDVHKEKIVACILTDPLGKPTHSETREFTTLIPDMIALRD